MKRSARACRAGRFGRAGGAAGHGHVCMTCPQACLEARLPIAGTRPPPRASKANRVLAGTAVSGAARSPAKGAPGAAPPCCGAPATLSLASATAACTCLRKQHHSCNYAREAERAARARARRALHHFRAAHFFFFFFLLAGTGWAQD